MSALTAFARLHNPNLPWPAEIAHLKGKILVRKKDGCRFIIERPEGKIVGIRPAAYLAPLDNNWPIVTRSYWKTYAKVLREFSVEGAL